MTILLLFLFPFTPFMPSKCPFFLSVPAWEKPYHQISVHFFMFSVTGSHATGLLQRPHVWVYCHKEFVTQTYCRSCVSWHRNATQPPVATGRLCLQPQRVCDTDLPQILCLMTQECHSTSCGNRASVSPATESPQKFLWRHRISVEISVANLWSFL